MKIQKIARKVFAAYAQKPVRLRALYSIYFQEVFMHITFTFRNFEASEHLKKYARRRFEKVGRFLGKNAALDLQVLLSVDKHRQKVEVILSGEGMNVSTAEESNDMYASIDLMTDKLESQIRKHATKSRERHKVKENIDIYSYQVEEEEGVKIVSGDEFFSPKPVMVEEAILQLEKNNAEFIVFLNAELDRVNVLYKKRNGNFGLIDPVI